MQENQLTPSATGNHDSDRTHEDLRVRLLRTLYIRSDITAATALPLTRSKPEKLSALKQKVAQLTDQLVAAKQEIAEKNAEIDALDGRLGRVTQAWAELDEQAEDLQERLALSEQRTRAHADDYLSAVAENGELRTQLAAAQEELAAIRAREAHRDEVDHANMSILLKKVLKTWEEADLEDEGLAAARRLVEAGPDSRDTAMAVKQALQGIIDAWALDMKQLQEDIGFFERVMLPGLDARIGNIGQHKKVIEQLSEPDLKDWHAALSGRAELNRLKHAVVLHRERALDALETARLALKKQSSVFVIDSSFWLAHHLVTYARDQAYYLSGSDYHDVDSDLGRTFESVQYAIRKLVTSGKTYSAPPEESVSYSTSNLPEEWRLTIPEPSAPDYFSSPVHDYTNDFAINPANGVPMNGGMGGTDWYGNLYGSNMNDPW